MKCNKCGRDMVIVRSTISPDGDYIECEHCGIIEYINEQKW